MHQKMHKKLVGGDNVAEGIYKRKDDYQGYVAVTILGCWTKQAKEPGYQVNMEYPKVDEEFILPELSEFETRLNNLNFLLEIRRKERKRREK